MHLQSDVQIMKDSHRNSEILINLQKEEIIELKKALREFTSFKYDDYDDTYEAVLKAEFDRMKVAYEARINKIQQEMEIQRKEAYSMNLEQTKQITSLRDTIERLTQRLALFK